MDKCTTCDGTGAEFIEWKLAPKDDFEGIAVMCVCRECKGSGVKD